MSGEFQLLVRIQASRRERPIHAASAARAFRRGTPRGRWSRLTARSVACAWEASGHLAGFRPAQRLSSKRTDDLLLPGRGHLREDGGCPPDGSGGKPSGSLSGSRGSLPGRLNGHAWPGCLRRSCRLHASKRRQSRLPCHPKDIVEIDAGMAAQMSLHSTWPRSTARAEGKVPLACGVRHGPTNPQAMAPRLVQQGARGARQGQGARRRQPSDHKTAPSGPTQ